MEAIRTGTVLELSLWYDAAKTLDTAGLREQLSEAFGRKVEQNRVRTSPLSFSTLNPGDDRVPKVPLWLENEKGSLPRLLHAEAVVLGSSEVLPVEQGLTGDLDKKDLAKLRRATRRAHKKSRPNESRLTDIECDTIIDAAGIEVVLEQLKKLSAR